IQADFRKVDLNRDFGLAILSFGDFNTFPRKTARLLLKKLFNEIKPGGLMLLEILTEEGVQNIAERDASWLVQESGIFSEQPHLFMDKYRFNNKSRSAEADYFVINDVGRIDHYSQHYARYSDDEYQHLLLDSGFKTVEFYPGFGSGSHDFADDLQIIVARK
ncbi:MAG: hypothetical protein JXR87_10775, partial [Candidatus Marinimicrobia bacterium]|nr:hypothetical protein [Candidatus Neomarinimicrobiota bacterium]